MNRRHAPACDCGARDDHWHAWTCPAKVFEATTTGLAPSCKPTRRNKAPSETDRGGGVKVWHAAMSLGGLSDSIGDTTVTLQEWRVLL